MEEEAVWGCLVPDGVNWLANLGHTLGPKGITSRLIGDLDQTRHDLYYTGCMALGACACR